MKGRIIGLVVLALVIAAGAAAAIYGIGVQDTTIVRGYISPDKVDFFEDPEVKRILKWKYGLEVDYREAGSIEMVADKPGGADFYFGSGQYPEYLLTEAGEEVYASETAFYSPLVFYSWDVVLEGIEDSALTTSEEGFTYMDLAEYDKMVSQGKLWRDLGSGAQGRVYVQTANPERSVSAQLYYGLLATVLNSEQAPTAQQVPQLKGNLLAYTEEGQLEDSADDLFKDYLKTGPGSKAMIAGYESQILSFALHNPEVWEKIKERVRIVYPQPTVWAEHTVIGMNESGRKLVLALGDEDLQKRARVQHGFRTNVLGAMDDVIVSETPIVPDSLQYVVGLPQHAVMEEILKALGGQ